jgi:hypothetical protein
MNQARRAELEERCTRFLVANEPTPAQLLEFVQQVEREVWTKAAEGYARYINGEFDEPRFEDWCIQQREGR